MSKNILPTQQAGAIAAALLLSMMASGAQALDVKLSGQVNRLLTHVDDGVQSRLFHADNVNSQTRFRFTGTQDVEPGLQAGLNWEVGYSSNPSNAISMTTRSVDGAFAERHAELFLTGGWGKVSFGQGDGAANGGMEVDLSGTTVINYSGVTDIGAKFAFRQGATVGPTIDTVIGNLDFESRYDRLRYDSPRLGPVMLSASYGNKGNNDVFEAAASAASALGGGKVAGALGWSREKQPGLASNEDTVGGSVSWLDGSGLNLTVALGASENDDPSVPRRKFGYGKVGYVTGKHAVSIDYGSSQDFALDGDRAKVYGVGYVYAPQTWIDLYSGVKQHQLDRAGSDFENITLLTAGTRLKF